MPSKCYLQWIARCQVGLERNYCETQSKLFRTGNNYVDKRLWIVIARILYNGILAAIAANLWLNQCKLALGAEAIEIDTMIAPCSAIYVTVAIEASLRIGTTVPGAMELDLNLKSPTAS